MNIHRIAAESRGRASDGLHLVRVHGLFVASELPLAELAPMHAEDVAGASPDVRIRLRPTGRRPQLDGSEVVFDFAPGEQYFVWPKVAAFIIRGSDEIDIEPHPEASERLLAYPLLGPVFAVLLHLRGLLVLHASAVDIGGRCVAFLGDKMAGKSTTAAAFIAAGYPMVTDDLLAIDCSAPTPIVLPGPAQIKLSSEATDRLNLPHAEAQPLPVENFPKRPHLLRQGVAQSALPLARLYALERCTEATIVPLAGAKAMTLALRFSYAARFGKQIIHGADAVRHLAQCAALSRTVTIARLETPNDLARLDEIIALVEHDVRRD